MTCPFLPLPCQDFYGQTEALGLVKSGSISDTALKAGGLRLGPEQASEQDYYRNWFTCCPPGAQALEKYKLFDLRYGERYLDVVPLAWRHAIFNAFKSNGLTPDTMGDVRLMTVSAEMEEPKQILADIPGRAEKKGCAEVVSFLVQNECIPGSNA